MAHQLEQAVKKQIEFYFSDSNFRKDTFLRAAAESDPEGYIPLTVLLTFNKLKALTTDTEIILDAIKDSDIVAISEDRTKIKRISDLPTTDDSEKRTLYVKGYPISDADVTIESITETFSKYGKVLMVRMRKTKEKEFKGSCFIEFEKIEDVEVANNAANEGGTMQLSFKDTPFLCILPFVEWLAKKKAKSERKKNKTFDPKVGEKRKADGGEEDANKVKKIEYVNGLILHITNVPSDSNLFQIKDVTQILIYYLS